MSNRDKLLEGHEKGNLLQTVYACLLADRDNKDALALELVALHNEGAIDVVAAFECLSNSSGGPDFFLTRDVFEKALPELQAPIPSVMRCVLRLYRAAGQDLVAGTVINGFIDFCQKSVSRPGEALALIEANPEEFAELLPATLIAGSRVDAPLFLTESIRLCDDSDIELRRQAVFSLGKIKLPETTAAPGLVLAALERVAKTENDDQVLAGIVRSAFQVMEQHRIEEPGAVTIITTALSNGGDNTLHAASEIFAFHTAQLSATLLDVLVAHLVSTKAANRRTLDNVDHGILKLFKNGHSETAIRFLEDLLLAHPDDLTMDVFDSAAREILHDKILINKILTRWFLGGTRVLCRGVHTIVAAHHGNEMHLEVDLAELTPNDLVHTIFVAKKAVGYLFFRPITAASILISLMRNCGDEKVLPALGGLLFNPLLVNFTGKARDYVAKQVGVESGKVKSTIEQALKTVDDYLDRLRSVGDLPALHPSETQREAYQRFFSQRMAEAFKAAEAESVFSQIVSKSVLLYGRKSINYVYQPDGQTRRIEIPLQSHGAEIESPRMAVIDPLGLDFMLMIFRNEQLKV